MSNKEIIQQLEVGDLIRLNGNLRVVRDVGRRPDGRVFSIGMAIMRCSWTRKPYTYRTVTDFYHVTLEIVQKGYGVAHTELERILQEDMAKRAKQHVTLQCCDVIGVIA